MIQINGMPIPKIKVSAHILKRLWYWLTNKYVGELCFVVNGAAALCMDFYYRETKGWRAFMYFPQPIVIKDTDKFEVKFFNNLGECEIEIAPMGVMLKEFEVQ